jgi:protein-disulfide isomerase
MELQGQLTETNGLPKAQMKHYIRNLTRIGIVCLFALGLCQGAGAQKKDKNQQLRDDIATLQTEVKTLSDQQQQIISELDDLKKLMQASARPSEPGLQLPPTLAVEGDPVEGVSTAKVAIIEFTDFQCPYCGHFAKETYPQLMANYISSGKVKLYYRDFPLTFHQDAMPAAHAARCAGEQGKFWEMHDSLFANQSALADKDLRDRSSKLGLDTAKFSACLASDKYYTDIQDSIRDAQKMGIGGTPAFILGTIQPDGSVKVAKGFVGARPYDAFKSDLDQLLAANK